MIKITNNEQIKINHIRNHLYTNRQQLQIRKMYNQMNQKWKFTISIFFNSSKVYSIISFQFQIYTKNLNMIFMQSLQRNKQESLKHRMFYLHHQILKHYSVPNKLYGILLIIQMLQMLYYGIHSTYPNLWDLQMFTVIQKILHFVQISGLWQVVGDTALLTFIILTFILYTLNVCFILYEVLKKDYKNKIPNIIVYKYIAYLGIFTKTILFIPTVYACLSFIMANSQNFPFQITPSVYGVIATLSIPTLSLLFINTIDFDIFLRENNPFSSLPFVCSVSQNQEIRTLIKLIMGCYGALSYTQGSVGKIFCILMFILNVFYMYKVYASPKMLKFPYGMLIELTPCFLVWICFQSILQQFIYTGQEISLLFLPVGMLLIPHVWIQIKQRHRGQIMYSNYKFITSPEQLLYYNYECLNCVNNLDNVRNLIYLEGILNYHISQCKKTPQTCVCFKVRQQMSNFGLQGEKNQIAQEKQLWFKFIRQNLSEIKQKYRNIPEISMLLAYIQRDQLNNKFKALHNLEEPSNFTSGLKIQFLNYHYLRQIEERMFNQDKLANQKKNVDVNKYFEFQTNFGNLQKAIEQSTIAHLNFWSNLESELGSKKKLITDGKIISDKVAQTRTLYQKLIELNPSNLHCLIMYANYMKIIVNNPQVYEKSSEAIKVIKRNILNSGRLNSDAEKQKYGDNAVTGVIIISGERSNIGVIKHCNTKITQLIKYSPHQLLGQNVNILMPKFIGSMHDDILMSYLELTESKYDNNQRLAPMIDKDNYLVFARILTKPLPSLFNGLELVGFFNLVTESHIDHPGETPKYVLFRTDSGQVQALSQACDTQFNYRINKIDQNHETSSELTFNSLFYNIKDSQLTVVDKPVKSKVRIINEQNDHHDVSVEVYLRHQIFYFGVKLKLLYFFTLKSYKNIAYQNEPQVVNNGVYKKIMVQQQQAEGLKYHESQKPNEAAKQKKIKQLMRKKNNTEYIPLSLKILSRFGYLGHLVSIGLVIFFLITDLSSNSYLEDFLEFSRISLETQAYISEINYFSRMKHLSYFYPQRVNEFSHYSNNISQLSSQLQKKQFTLVQYALQADNNGLDYNTVPLSWTINQKLQISSASTTLDVNVFDYITGASHFYSTPVNNLSFPLQLFKQPTNTSSYIDLFHLRYTGLFETIPNKNAFYQSSDLYFNTIQQDLLGSRNFQLGLSCAFYFLMLVICIPLLLCLDKFINQTVMLFGYMNTMEIEKEVQNCKLFLEIFFKDSYTVKLTFKKKNDLQNVDVLSTNELALARPKTFSSPNAALFNLKEKSKQQRNHLNTNTNSNSQDFFDERPRKGTILSSTQKIQALQVQFNTISNEQKQATLNQKDQYEEEKQQMLLKTNYDEDESIYEKLQKTKDNSKYKYILVMLFVVCVYLTYFSERYVINTDSIKENHLEIKNLKMITESLNLMKKVKLYGIQSVIDNSQFKNYQLLSNMLQTHVIDLYEHQRRYNTYIYPASGNLATVFGNDKISSLIKESLCLKNNIDTYLNTVNLTNIFPKQSYDQKQCELIQDGILKQGLRPALIAFTEILSNFTTSPHTIEQMVNSQKFLSVVKMQKYLQGIQLFYLEKLQTNIYKQINNFKQLLIIIAIIMIFVIIALMLLVWWPMINNLSGKIVSSSQILALIPLRIFTKNSKLYKQYQKFVTQMME